MATIGTLFVVCSFFVWIWFGFMLSLKMFIIGNLGVILGMTLENMIISYVDKQLEKEMDKPDNVGKWENRMIMLNEDSGYKFQKKENTETIKKIMDNICKN